MRDISQRTLRIQETLENSNIKRSSALSSILGTMAGPSRVPSSPEKLTRSASRTWFGAAHVRNVLHSSLHGRITPHHRRLLKLHLDLIGALEAALSEVDADVGKLLAPIQKSARLLTTMPGVSELTAQVVPAGIGVDMRRFPGR